MIAMTMEQFRQSTSQQNSCLRHPADEHRHLRHGAMIWHTCTTSSNESKIARPLQGEDEVSFEDIRISHVVLRKRRVEVPKKVLNLPVSSLPPVCAPKSASLQRSGLAHPSANYRGSHCGKLGGRSAARLAGMKWRESLQLGALMNTCRRMELIVLNIGYDMGILSQHIFTMLVIMTLVTTIMTGPLVLVLGKHERWLERDPSHCLKLFDRV